MKNIRREVVVIQFLLEKKSSQEGGNNISSKRITAWMNESEWLNVFHSVIQSCIHSFKLALVYQILS